MSAYPWMPFYVADYRGDTAHLTAAQHGAYLLLIMHYWQQGSLPDDDEQLARIACMSSAEWRKSRPVVRSFFGDAWKHSRIDRELFTANERYEKRANAGKRGNLVRWSGRNAIAMGSQLQPQSQSQDKSLSQGEGTTYQGKPLGSDTRRLMIVGGPVLAADGREDEQ